MPMAEISGSRWVRALRKFVPVEHHQIIWPSAPPDTPTEFDGQTRCVGGRRNHTPKDGGKGFTLAGSEEVLGHNVRPGLVCQGCYHTLRPLGEQLRGWKKETIQLLKGQPLPE